VDLLAHPGFITEEEAALAAANGVGLELTARRGHNMTNGHVAHIARLTGAMLVINTDSHTPADMLDQAGAHLVALGAGLTEEEALQALGPNAHRLALRALGPATQSI
jgi:histidinol phosphatase-like PHP family hydrolase